MINYAQKKYYEILGLKPDATQEQIKKAFRLATVKFHPDVNKTGEKIFIEIKEAYEVLSNPEERKKYDFINGYDILREKKAEENKIKNEYVNKDNTYKKADYTKNTYTSENNSVKTEYTRHDNFGQNISTQNNSNAFSDFMKNIFGGIKNQRNEKPKQNPVDGSDITMNIDVSFKEAVNGTNRKINVLHTEVCPVCKGKTFANGSKCRYCNGTGEISQHKKINVKIPTHTENNKKIRLKGEGTKGTDGGKNGNLYLIVRITDDSNFKFDGNNVLSELEITPYEAALGSEKEVMTLSGKAKVKIPAGTSSGQKFSLAKEGLFDEIKKIKGNQIITVKIKVRENLSEKERKLYEELKKLAEEK